MSSTYGAEQSIYAFDVHELIRKFITHNLLVFVAERKKIFCTESYN